MQVTDQAAESAARLACQLSLARLAHWLPPNVQRSDLFNRFYSLCCDQNLRLTNGKPVSPIPLWVVALCHCLGVYVEVETAVIALWPRELPQELAGLTVDDTGRIIRWPVDAPVEVRL